MLLLQSITLFRISKKNFTSKIGIDKMKTNNFNFNFESYKICLNFVRIIIRSIRISIKHNFITYPKSAHTPTQPLPNTIQKDTFNILNTDQAYLGGICHNGAPGCAERHYVLILFHCFLGFVSSTCWAF